MLLLLLKLYAVEGLFVKYEGAVGASPINTLRFKSLGSQVCFLC